jgi:hypothetical protein
VRFQKGAKEAGKALYKAGDMYYAALRAQASAASVLARKLGENDVMLRLGAESLHWVSEADVRAATLGWWSGFVDPALTHDISIFRANAVQAAVVSAMGKAEAVAIEAPGSLRVDVARRAAIGEARGSLDASKSALDVRLERPTRIPKLAAAAVESANTVYTIITVVKMLGEKEASVLRAAPQVDVLFAATAGIKVLYQGAALADKLVAAFSVASVASENASLAAAQAKVDGILSLGGTYTAFKQAEAGVRTATAHAQTARILRVVLPQAARVLNAASLVADVVYVLSDEKSELARAASRGDSTLVGLHSAELGVKGIMASVAAMEFLSGAGLIGTTSLFCPPLWIGLCIGSCAITCLIYYYETECKALYEAFQKAVRAEFMIADNGKAIPTSSGEASRYFRKDVLLSARR